MDFPFRTVRVEEFCDGSVRPVSVCESVEWLAGQWIQRGSDGDFSVLPTNDSICSSLVHRQAVKTMLCYSARVEPGSPRLNWYLCVRKFSCITRAVGSDCDGAGLPQVVD